jgi:hypothetical protein
MHNVKPLLVWLGAFGARQKRLPQGLFPERDTFRSWRAEALVFQLFILPRVIKPVTVLVLAHSRWIPQSFAKFRFSKPRPMLAAIRYVVVRVVFS